jgi:hypothetical protein
VQNSPFHQQAEEIGEYLMEVRTEPRHNFATQKSLNSLAAQIWQTADDKGFHEPVDTAILYKALRLLLIVSEVAEMLEAMRKGDEEHEREEFADSLIRLLHYGAAEGIDIDAEVSRKMKINNDRPHKHNKVF